MSLIDGAVLAIANVYAVLCNPRLALRFLVRRKQWPLFATPRGHSALVQWRKIFDHNPQFTVLCDKLEAKQFALARDPQIDEAEVVWRGQRPEDIPDALVQPGYVIKANHGFGFNYFPHREPLARAELNRRCAAWMEQRFGRGGQWGYRRVEPVLYVERLVGDGRPLWEMTFRCHDGRVSAYYVAIEQKTPREQGAFFDGDGRRLPPVLDQDEAEQLPRDFVPPPVLARARSHAERLSRGLDYARVDLMCDGDAVLFCEYTIYPGSGFGIEGKAHIAPLIERAWIAAIHRSWFLTTRHSWPMSLYAVAFERWVGVRRRELVDG